VFALTSQEAAFRKAVLSDNGLRFIPKDQQFPLAQKLRADLDTLKAKRGHDAGSLTITQSVQDVLREAMGLQGSIDEQEKQTLLQANDADRINGRWTTLRRGLQQAEAALAAIAEEEKAWSYKTPFPIDADAVSRLQGMSKRVDLLAKKYFGM
jgi:hypothetical protein